MFPLYFVGGLTNQPLQLADPDRHGRVHAHRPSAAERQHVRLRVGALDDRVEPPIIPTTTRRW